MSTYTLDLSVVTDKPDELLSIVQAFVSATGGRVTESIVERTEHEEGD